ncbi:MAG: ATP-binding protein [Acidimicrobiales bacterium]|nr:ATP-binding protein [Acidimicrobiales bacterium]
MVRPILAVTVGLPGMGKTTRAMEVEEELGAIRFTVDAWLKPLFGEANPREGRYIMEGRLIATARRLLELGQSVILDFGFWSRDERSALHDLARACGAEFRIEYADVERDEQWRRVDARQRSDHELATSFTISRDMLDVYADMFDPPTADELAATEPPPAPPEAGTWSAWRAARWPTSEEP